MGKCIVCAHYQYHAGVRPSLARLLNKDVPNRPTNYCNYAGVAWERYSAEIRKPKGIKCDYRLAEMHCADCGKQIKSHKDCWLKLTKDSCICQKCAKYRTAQF